MIFYPPQQIKKIIDAVNLDHHWLALSILATTGIKLEELLNLKVEDRKDQVLKLNNNSEDNEWIVVPKTVNKVLDGYIIANELHSNDKIIPFSLSNLRIKVVLKYSRKCGTPFLPHYLRKWCASFWFERDDIAMAQFVLRQRPETNQGIYFHRLYDTYHKPLSVDEVIERQNIMDNVLFHNIV